MKKKVLIPLILLGLFIFGLVVGISQMVKDPERYNTMDPNIRKIMDTCEVSEEQATVIWDILKECGTGEIKAIERDELLDGAYDPTDIGYRIETKDGNHPVLYLNGSGEVHLFRYAGKDLYSNE